MISSEIKKKIENLFSEKKYQEVINVSDAFISKSDRPPGLACLIGTCKFLKKEKNKDDLISALQYFEEAYIKDKKGLHGLTGVTNYLNTAVFGAKRYNELKVYLKKAEQFYKHTRQDYEKNPDFLIASKKLFSYQLDKINQKEIAEKIISKPNFPLSEKIDSIFFQNYIFDWSQQKYTESVKNISKQLPNYDVKDLAKLNLEENKKINIGFVSADFTDQHSIFYFIKDVLINLNRDLFKIYLFSFDRGSNNQVIGQKEIKSFADEFIDLESFTNQESIELIQEKKINILVDVMGLTFHKRIPIFNSRVSPIQISWLASCNTNGIENIDYLIADNNVISEEEDELYPEKIIKMPEIWNAHCGYNYDRKLYESPCERNDYFTFGSLNNFHKLSDEVVETWSKILQMCEKSKLILKSSSSDCNIDKIKNKFDKFGVLDKITLLDVKNYAYKVDHLGVYKDIDLALDTFPYNGVTTTFEALWMGAPVIVLKGSNFNSKCGFSIIKNSNFINLISKSPKEYVERAVYFYNNKSEFLELKKNLFNNILSSPLFNTKQFSENFSKSLLSIVKNKL